MFSKPKVEQVQSNESDRKNENINKRKRELSINSSSSMYTKNNKMQTTSTSLSSSCSFSNPEIPHSTNLKNDYNIKSIIINDNLDIGKFINTLIPIDDFTKCALLEKHWVPPPGYIYPFFIHIRLFCKYCVLYAPNTSNNITLKTFVKKPLKNFSKLTGKDGTLKTHGNHKYHKFAVKSRNNFLAAYHNPQKVIINQINTQQSIQVNENRKRLVPIIETIIFYGRQNLALRGHRDDGLLDDDASPSNEENFRELLMFRINAGDKTLESHINTTSSRSTFISKTTQNDLIDCIGEEIQSQIINNVRMAGMFAIIFYETTDISHVEQLSLVLRYVLDNKVHEDFITFVDAYKSVRPEDIPNPYEVKLSGKAIGHVVLDIISKLGLDLDKCIGIGTDGAAVMVSECPCFNHALYNSLAQASTIPSIRNTIATLKAIIAFFNTSAKKHKLLTDTIGHKLIGLCQTRWVELHDCIIQFKKILPQLESSMATSKAKSFVLSICDTDFIFALTCLSFVLEHTLPLSKILQSTTIDLKNASEIVQCTITVLQSNRTVFLKNYNSQSIDEYYRISMFIPLLDSIIEDLKRRFTLPNYQDRVLNVSKRFSSIEPNKLHGETILGELEIWCQKWKLIAEEGVEECLDNAIEAFFFL
ncbi:hypothetical protein QTP88_009856 [Uroleucon formosanum]